MKSFKQYLKETPPTNWTNSTSTVPGFSSGAEAPVAGYDPKLFKDPVTDDLLSQDYQTPGQSGLAKWRFSTIWPVSHLTMSGIDAMVNASNEYVNLMDKNTEVMIKKNFSRFMGEAKEAKKCPDGQYWCYTDKKCKTIPRGYHIGRSGYLAHDHKNGNGNGSHNGNGNGNGNGGNGNGGNGNGGGGNGGGNGG